MAAVKLIVALALPGVAESPVGAAAAASSLRIVPVAVPVPMVAFWELLRFSSCV